jgi:Ca-activated chloride channel family protein
MGNILKESETIKEKGAGKTSFRLCVCLLLFSLLLSFSSLAQAQVNKPPAANPNPTPDGDEIDEGDVISVSTSEVMLPVTVRDAGGRLVTNLTRDDFRVLEDGRLQPLSDLAIRHVPVDVVLMVDASSSAAANLDDFQRAVEGFASNLEQDDRVSLIKFDDRVELLQDWTTSRLQLRRSLRRIVPGVFTRFNDALLLAAREQLAHTRGRHAVIVLTDGIDSGRGYSTLEAALRALLEAQATIYVVSNTEIERRKKREELDSLLASTASVARFNELRINDLREGLRVLDVSERNLEQLTTATGGRLYKPSSFNELDATYREVAEELRHQYALYYTPLNKARDGRFRRVRVETTSPAYKVSARIGYFAPGK